MMTTRAMPVRKRPMRSGNSSIVADHAERDRALDTSLSFIVRAPAGSGKTRLLIQRYLALLARVDEPEEIVAITFTRKAAAEMRQRVLSAFVAANNPDACDDADTARLARAVLVRDAERGWQILSNASRLRMQTIDSLNASITRQMPLLARFGAQPESIDDASGLYCEAARNLLAQVNDGNDVANDVATLLAHLDNNVLNTESLLADVLRSRDHWLRNLRAMHEREMLEAALARVCAEAVARTAAAFPAELKNETLALARLAGQYLAAESVESGLCVLDAMTEFPDDEVEALPAWLALAELLLTKTGTWRKVVNKNQGFPVGVGKDEKARLSVQKNRMNMLLAALASGDTTGNTMAAALQQLRSLPATAYSESQWQILGAIVRLLPHATAALWSVFGEHGQCDFTEIAEAASRALGHDDAPTDLALALDYRISHLLVDEFQDTSFAQFELLEKLTRGWSHDDGRTLFLVGDPMQSIYRFREAEVSLFSRAWRDGVGGVRLHPLTLRVNFRSEIGVVEWVNNTFQTLMPADEDTRGGAVPYASSVAFAAGDAVLESQQTAVTLHPYFLHKISADSDASEEETAPSADVEEALRVVNIVNATRAEKPDAIIAILVRTRGHLREIVPALKAANIVFRAVDIDPLKGRAVVQDLLSLTRALLHPADRIAWLAVLRAPWCGLTLNDLASLMRGAMPLDGVLAPDARTVWELLNDAACVTALSADGQARVKKFCAALEPALQMRRRLPLRDAVENTWLKLQGPACLTQENDLDDAAMLLDLLQAETQALANGGQLIDVNALESRVDRLFAGNLDAGKNKAAPPVQIMTIHKAKGLEFDTVIVPGLHRPPRRDDKKLIVWTEQANPDSGEAELLLAPIRETGAEDDTEADAIYRYVVQQEREKQRQEIVRLLYVAATRAERRLHLLGAVNVKAEGEGSENAETFAPPRTESLLAALWPAVSSTIVNDVNADDAATDAIANVVKTESVAPRGPMRISSTQTLPAMPDAISGVEACDGAQLNVASTNIDFEWASETARHIGSVVHAFLQRIADDGVEKWNRERIASNAPTIERELAWRGVATDELPVATSRVIDALANTVADSRGRWALQSHREARAEWRLTGMRNGALVNIAIDRTFVDDENVRWIIDFKTGSHDGGDVDAFLDNERKRYSAQLETYATILSAMQGTSSETKIKLGLYFPMLKGWREWTWDEVAGVT